MAFVSGSETLIPIGVSLEQDGSVSLTEASDELIEDINMLLSIGFDVFNDHDSNTAKSTWDKLGALFGREDVSFSSALGDARDTNWKAGTWNAILSTIVQRLTEVGTNSIGDEVSTNLSRVHPESYKGLAGLLVCEHDSKKGYSVRRLD